MRAGPLGGGDDGLGINLFRQARDVFRDRGFEQRHVLRQIPDMGAQDVILKLVQRGAVQPDFALCGLPDIRQRTGQCRLARRAGPDDAQRLTRFDLQRQAAQRRGALARRDDGQPFDDQLAFRLRQRRARRLIRRFRQQLGQFIPAILGALDVRPLPDRLLNRR